MHVLFSTNNSKGFHKIRISKKLILQWSQEGTVLPNLQKKIQLNGFKNQTVSQIKIPTKSTHLDYNKFEHLGLMGKTNEVKCTTNPKGVFNPNYKPRKFVYNESGKRKYEYVS